MENQTELLETLRQAKREQEQFLSTKAWTDYEQLIKAQIRSLRQEDFLSPIASVDGAFLSCQRKAMIAGLSLAISLPQATIEDLAVDIENLVSEIEGEVSWLQRMRNKLATSTQAP